MVELFLNEKKPSSLTNIQVEMLMEDGSVLKHIVQNYELLTIQKDPDNDQIAFIVRKPDFIDNASWTVAHLENFDINKVESTQETPNAPGTTARS